VNVEAAGAVLDVIWGIGVMLLQLLVVAAVSAGTAWLVGRSGSKRMRLVEESINLLRLQVRELRSGQPSVGLPTRSQQANSPVASGEIPPAAREALFLRDRALLPEPTPPAQHSEIAWDDFVEEAAAALGSAARFADFADRYPTGVGFVQDSTGRSTRPSRNDGPPGRADLWAIEAGGQTFVFPGFNLRRSEPLLIADKGRPAQARLGELFQIVAGDSLRAVEPAEVSLPDWRVIRQGRLTLPL
jgi:hypothetical protein